MLPYSTVSLILLSSKIIEYDQICLIPGCKAGFKYYSFIGIDELKWVSG